MCSLVELDRLVPFLQSDADAGLELVGDEPMELLEHGGDVDLLHLLDECGYTDWHQPPPSPPKPSPRRKVCKRLFAATVPSSGCTCRKSRCLKLYCDCYAAGKACGSTCRCVDCQNFADAAEPRKKARPCTCKRNGCKTKYCECKAAGRACTHACSCTGCENCTRL